jgi:hypothetical protein
MQEIKQEKVAASKAAKQMMLNVLKENKDLPFQRCIDKRLEMFSDMSYVKSVCLQMFGMSDYSICSKKKNYCKMCCRHHIGLGVYDKYSYCYLKCSKLVNC